MPKRGRGKASRGGGRGRSRGTGRIVTVSRRVLPLRRSFTRGVPSEDTEDLNLRLAFLRGETGYQAMSHHGLTSSEGTTGQGELEVLRAEITQCGGTVPKGRWGSDLAHLRKKLEQLKQRKPVKTEQSAAAKGDESAGGSTGDDTVVNREMRKLQKILDGGMLDYEDRESVTEELRLVKTIAETAVERRNLGQSVYHLGEKMKAAQNNFNAKKPNYNKEKEAAGSRGELLRAIRAATAPFVTNGSYVEDFEAVTAVMLDYRKTFEEQVSAEKNYKAVSQQHEAEQDAIEDMRARLRQLERKRKAKELERQIAKKPRRGFGVDDGSSQKTSSDSSSSASSISLPPDPPPVCDEVNSLAFDDMDDEEDEGEAAAAAEVGSSVEANEDEF
eukprot:COSAG05_NODE_51_length_23916_cov_18.924931_17_plen_387_part_00